MCLHCQTERLLAPGAKDTGADGLLDRKTSVNQALQGNGHFQADQPDRLLAIFGGIGTVFWTGKLPV